MSPLSDVSVEGGEFNSPQHFWRSTLAAWLWESFLPPDNTMDYLSLLRKYRCTAIFLLEENTIHKWRWCWCFNLLDRAVEVIVRWWALTPMIHLEIHCCTQPAVSIITSSIFGVNPPILETFLFTSSFYFPLRSFILTTLCTKCRWMRMCWIYTWLMEIFSH